MIKPSNACVLLIVLNVILGMATYVGMETKAISSSIGTFIGVFLLLTLIGIYYVREFAKRAEAKLGWN